jgi:hypothetical protein
MVPPGTGNRQLVVGEHVGALLRLGPARSHHHRNLGDAELPGGEYPGVARNQATVLAHQRRRRPAPLLDARGYRGDLGIRVGPCIFGVWDQPIDRPTLDLVGRPRSLISGRLSRAGARTRRGSIMKVGDTSQKGTGPEEVLCPPARQSPATAPDTCKPAGQPIRRRCAPPVPSLRPLPLQRHPPPGPVRALSRLCRTAERRGASAASTGAARGRHRLART